MLQVLRILPLTLMAIRHLEATESMGKTERDFADDGDKVAEKRRRKEHQEKVAAGLESKVKKSLPEGYKCNACGAIGEHAIYDCPQKKEKKKAKSCIPVEATQGGSSTSPSSSSRKKEVVDEKDLKQVYISGLPFDMTVAKLLKELQDRDCEGVKQPFGVHVVTFDDNKTKCKGIAFVSFVDRTSADACCEKFSGISLNEAKPHVKIVCEINKRKQEKEWKPPSEAKVSLKFSGNNYNSGKNGGGEREKKCYRCGGNHNPATCEAERICYRCKQTGHLSSQCPLRPGGPKPLLPTSKSELVSSSNTKITFGEDD